MRLLRGAFVLFTARENSTWKEKRVTLVDALGTRLATKVLSLYNYASEGVKV